MFAFILDSLGSTELLFILIVALIFFGPRKLPQLARSMGKSLAEFRKASEDFKRTWEREVELESVRSDAPGSWAEPGDANENPESAHASLQPVPVTSDLAVARDGRPQLPINSGENSPSASPKHDWL